MSSLCFPRLKKLKIKRKHHSNLNLCLAKRKILKIFLDTSEGRILIYRPRGWQIRPRGTSWRVFFILVTTMKGRGILRILVAFMNCKHLLSQVLFQELKGSGLYKGRAPNGKKIYIFITVVIDTSSPSCCSSRIFSAISTALHFSIRPWRPGLKRLWETKMQWTNLSENCEQLWYKNYKFVYQLVCKSCCTRQV